MTGILEAVQPQHHLHALMHEEHELHLDFHDHLHDDHHHEHPGTDPFREIGVLIKDVNARLKKLRKELSPGKD